MSSEELVSLSRQPIAFVIFGASGDLAVRMLLPSLHAISSYNAFHPKTKIIGVARSAFEDGEFKTKLSDGILQFSRLDLENTEHSENLNNFISRLVYIQGEYDDMKTFEDLKQELAKEDFSGVLIYMATPPTVIEPVSKLIKLSGLAHDSEHPNRWLRLICEKPFGLDYESAVHLNEILHSSLEEDQIYRIDHYLAKETVLNIFTFRWGNTIWEPLWNRNYISQVEIVVSETVDVNNRTGYYESSSVVRDMIQNHLLQMLAITAMEPPVQMNSKSIRDEKMKVLHAIRKVNDNDVILGQYSGYKEHQGVEKTSNTPTLAVVRLFIDNWRWQGVPFFLISGKNLSERSSTIKLTFNKVPHQIFKDTTVDKPNVLKIRIQPNEGISLKQHVKIPGIGLRTTQIPLNFTYSDKFGQEALQGAYERVFLDAVNGDQSFFPRSDEIEQSWKVVTPILKPTNKDFFVVPYAPGLDVYRGALRRNWDYDATVNHFTNAPELIASTTESITRLIVQSIEEKGVCNIALTGGGTPKPIYSQLATSPYLSRFDVTKIHFFFVDEICCEPTDPLSNYKMINESLFMFATEIPPENIHRIKGELGIEQAKKSYENELREHFKLKEGEFPVFDVILLGMGADGHTASLYPGCDFTCDKVHLVVGGNVALNGQDRVSLGAGLINNAKDIFFIVIGKEKRPAYKLVQHGPYCPSILSAQLVRPKDGYVTWNVMF